MAWLSSAETGTVFFSPSSKISFGKIGLFFAFFGAKIGVWYTD